MYFPYFRGKQFELLAIREAAQLLSDSDFIPIIEPVRETLNGLGRALHAVCEANGKAIVVVNPFHGDHADDGSGISKLLKGGFSAPGCIQAGILLTSQMPLTEALHYYNDHKDHSPSFIHAGFTEAKALAESLGDKIDTTRHIFFEEHCGALYRKHFKGGVRILLRDGFKRRKNSAYPPVEKFSELHVIYEDEGFDGFGDFSVVGDDYSEGGGPAYAVAIHLTFINAADDDVMYIYHFVSTTNDTPTDPAGKFSQALNGLVAMLDSGKSMLFESDALKEFRELHIKGHFPGLGYVKKLSMKHHIETLANFLST